MHIKLTPILCVLVRIDSECGREVISTYNDVSYVSLEGHRFTSHKEKRIKRQFHTEKQLNVVCDLNYQARLPFFRF